MFSECSAEHLPFNALQVIQMRGAASPHEFLTQITCLPPNTTLKTQPMDQGKYYRMQLVKNAIEDIDTTGNVKSISILEAMMLLKIAWHQVKQSTIIACFRKAGIAVDVQASVQDELDNPFLPLQDMMLELHSHQPELVPDQMTPESRVNADDDIETSGVITDAEIISEIHSGHNEEDDNDSDGDDISDEPQPRLTATEVHSVLQVIQRYALFVDNDDIGVLATKLSSAVSTASVQQKVQPKQTDFF